MKIWFIDPIDFQPFFSSGCLGFQAWMNGDFSVKRCPGNECNFAHSQEEHSEGSVFFARGSVVDFVVFVWKCGDILGCEFWGKMRLVLGGCWNLHCVIFFEWNSSSLSGFDDKILKIFVHRFVVPMAFFLPYDSRYVLDWAWRPILKVQLVLSNWKDHKTSRSWRVNFWKDHWILEVRILLPWNLTWNLKMEVWKMIFLFSWVLFRFHVKFQRCRFYENNNSTG